MGKHPSGRKEVWASSSTAAYRVLAPHLDLPKQGGRGLVRFVESPFRARRSFWAVDLGTLQTVGIVYVNRLPFGIEIDGGLSALAVAVAGGLGAAEGQVHLSPD